MDSERLIQNERFAGADWALDEVEHVRYEDCAFHDVDWSEARLSGCTFSYCEFGNVRFNAAVFERCAILQSVLQRCSFFDATLTDCKLTGSQFLDCGLRPLTIEGGDWAFVVLRGNARVSLAAQSDADMASLDGRKVAAIGTLRAPRATGSDRSVARASPMPSLVNIDSVEPTD